MPRSSEPWSVDRWGRLIAGAGFIAIALLALLHDPRWIYATLLGAFNLFATALTNRCPLHDLLMRLGAQEREDLFQPGGAPRHPAVHHALLPQTGRREPVSTQAMLEAELR